MKPPYPITKVPPNAGVRLSDLTGVPLPQAVMYQRNNFPVPNKLPEFFEIDVPGRGTRKITTADLAPLATTVEMVLECAGNGRTLMHPVPEGTPWDLGGVSPIQATGAPLSKILGELPDDIVDVVFTGADSGFVEDEGEIDYQFSLTRDEAMSKGPLLATHIDGTPLTALHGGPVRLLVPGQYAMKSVKWLTRIEAVRSAFAGHFVRKYRYYDDVNHPEAAPVGPIAVRSLIAEPVNGQRVSGGSFVVSGSAWSSNGVSRVEISTDHGRTWTDTDLEDGGPVAAHRWAGRVRLTGGVTVIMSRAVDRDGNVQPVRPVWNANGYANNVVHRIEVTVG